jgi:hypothetical protein
MHKRLRDLPPSLNLAAALAVAEASIEAHVDGTTNDPSESFWGVLVMLRALRPALTGPVRATVDRMFDNPDKTLVELGVMAG